MNKRIGLLTLLASALMLPVAAIMVAAQVGAGPNGAASRPQGPCDVYAAGKTPCVAAHSSTRALYAAYNGPLYQVLRQSDGKTLDIGVVPPNATDGGGYADAAAQDAFCAHTTCWIATLYDQSGKKNHLTQAPHGGWAGPAMGGVNNLPLADMAPVTLLGHKVYGIFIEPGMGLRWNDAHGTAVDDQAEGQYWVIDGHHFNSGCCFNYGNGETDSDNDGNGTMETTYYGNATNWYRGSGNGPWIMSDQENNLIGCVNPDGSKNCRDLPSVTWRFVTATMDGEPHRWRTLGGDAQTGDLKVMFDGPRADNSYDPMRKQGAVLLGNGGDNSNASQGTFYEGAMTAPNTFPSQEIQQKVQANIVAARYGVPRLSVAPAAAAAAPPGLQTFSPGSSQDTTVTFTNSSGAPATDIKLSLVLPAGWSADAASKTIAEAVAPGASVKAAFKITSGPAAFNGDLVANASWNSNGRDQSESASEKVRNVSPLKINEFAGSFIELYNAGDKEIDISHWSLTQHAIQQVPFSAIKIPAGTKLAPKAFYLLGLANSGLAVPAKKGDSTLYVRSVAGMNVGDTIEINTGAAVETRKIATLGTAAGAPPVLSIWGGNRTGSVGGNTIIWQPLPEGPIVTFPVGSTNIPVHNITNFQVGQKMAIGFGTAGPAVASGFEQYEIVTVTAVGKAGAQTYLATDAKAGDTSIRIRNAASLSVGDKIRLDIDNAVYGIETVTVKNIAAAGAAPARGPGAMGPAPDSQSLTFVAVPATTGTAPATGRVRGGMGGNGAMGTGRGGGGTVIELAAPLKFNHAANMPISIWGTGISFQPATAFVHASNEPVLPLGTGITLDKPLDNNHPLDIAVRNPAAPNQPQADQWFGGPALSYGGAMILRDAAGLVADSLNFGELVDPWAAEGYQAGGGSNKNGCRAPSPIASPARPARGGAPGGAPAATPSRSAGRITDGADADSNCTDFATLSPTPGAPNRR